MAANKKNIKTQAAEQLKGLAAAQIARKVEKSLPDMPEPNPEDIPHASMIVSKEVWNIFEEALLLNPPDNQSSDGPVFILSIAGRVIDRLLTQIISIAKNMKRIMNLPENRGKETELDRKFFEIFVRVLRTLKIIITLYPDQLDDDGKPMNGVIERGGFIDSAFGAAPIFLKAQLRKLFDYDEVARNTILVSDASVVTAFKKLNQASKNLSVLTRQLQVVVNDLQEQYPEDNFSPTLYYPRLSPEGSRRQDIGYVNYYESKYIEVFSSRPAIGLNDDGEPTGEPFLQWSTANKLSFSMYAAILDLINRIAIGNAPLMMEMLLDIMVAANVFLGRRSSIPDYEFGLSFKFSGLGKSWDAFGWLESYPEISVDGARERESVFDPRPADFMLPEGQHDRDPLAHDYLKFW
ncbi:hypothetical protein TWF718_000198 [Orbilia javanica]|uniref:Uncharacterized protein n=1 Tax=Orbilia javanica TaxID=47235 RepID=A0AAN8N760_9PEZI